MRDSSNKTFSDIYTTYYRKAFYFVKSYIHDEAAAEDLVSDSLIKVWEQMKQKEVDYVAPLLLAILKNKSLDYLKHEEVKRAALDEIASWRNDDLSLRYSSLEACNPDDIFSKEVETIVRDTLETMSPQTRRIFEMSRFENKTNNEIAEMLGLSSKSVEYHITKALKAMRVALKDYLPIFIFLFA